MSRVSFPLSVPLHAACLSNVLVVAHRGSWKQAPENSLAAVEEAIALGADMVEIDVQATVDGALFVLHDETLDRTTDGSGNLDAQTATEVSRHRLRRSDGTLSGEAVPTLEAVLACARDRVLVNIDMKTSDLAGPVADAVEHAGMAGQTLMKATICDAGDIEWACSQRFHGSIPFMPRMRARPGHFAQDLARFAVMRPTMAEVRFGALEDIAAGREELARQGMGLWANTLDVSHNLDLCDKRALADPDAVWGRLIDAGVTAIQTDETAALVAYLRKRGVR